MFQMALGRCWVPETLFHKRKNELNEQNLGFLGGYLFDPLDFNRFKHLNNVPKKKIPPLQDGPSAPRVCLSPTSRTCSTCRPPTCHLAEACGTKRETGFSNAESGPDFWTWDSNLKQQRMWQRMCSCESCEFPDAPRSWPASSSFMYCLQVQQKDLTGWLQSMTRAFCEKDSDGFSILADSSRKLDATAGLASFLSHCLMPRVAKWQGMAASGHFRQVAGGLQSLQHVRQASSEPGASNSRLDKVLQTKFLHLHGIQMFKRLQDVKNLQKRMLEPPNRLFNHSFRSWVQGVSHVQREGHGNVGVHPTDSPLPHLERINTSRLQVQQVQPCSASSGPM